MRYPSAEGAALFRPTSLRVVKLIYFDSPQGQAPIQVGVDLKLLISANGLAVNDALDKIADDVAPDGD